MKDPAVLPEDLRDLLDAERELDAPAGDTRQRLLARLGPLLIPPPGGAAAPETADAGSSAAEATRTVARAGLRAKLLVPAIAAALGAAGGAGIHAHLTRAPAVPQARQAAPGRADAPTPNAPAPSPPEAPAPEAPPQIPRAGGTAAAPPTASPPSPASASASLRGERLLLESATAALQRGDAPTALSTLRRHARLHPHGALAEEREVLWIKALRAQGDDSGAERRAKDFKKNFPSSLQQGAVGSPGRSR